MNEAVIIQDGFVIDPEALTITKMDIGILNGKFASIQQVQTQDRKEIQYINASGYYVSPGFIDLHAHIFKDYTELGIEPDTVGVEQGVTTIVDAGSSGFDNYSLLKEEIINSSKTEILTLINISRKGLCHGLSELANLRDLMTLEEAEQIFKREKNIVGLKARMSGSVVKESGIQPLKHARNIADHLHKPIMVHIGNPPPYLQEIFPLLKKGDIVTHAFHGKKHGVLNEEGELIPEASSAIGRGVRFDIGHGTSSFSYKTMRRFKEKYDMAFTISTDIYRKNFSYPVGSLMVTMSKLLALGYSLTEVVEAVTKRAADTLLLTEQGTFTLGTRADVTIFGLEEGESLLADSEGDELICHQILTPYMTLKTGKVAFKKDDGIKNARAL
ncbi:amidohydrolase/deacetylase family metallohydrolase [Bacillus canaveralius]|uniref:Amidohydrolase/deacetylase family metallohydrolase n=1 Tax=Bacillus canaveralius TaxID=1403243 RepID=A0A2N5GLN7_9BACI|nr:MULTISPECIES: amidohydrolase/deacetylase family metallohydrolase [Bacillus]PLR75960.1 amidohydrolase/deacetylase family metallohydrolase [Bacillus sp. V3-13]PLR82622.1 amidohydrolase/deacetylase family metallohydrolase [Bacillus canaveralius]PLR91251.1 amidohydrolase/deacetylase family metallohydrolase [Bacillus canaveralius]